MALLLAVLSTACGGERAEGTTGAIRSMNDDGTISICYVAPGDAGLRTYRLEPTTETNVRRDQLSEGVPVRFSVEPATSELPVPSLSSLSVHQNGEPIDC